MPVNVGISKKYLVTNKMARCISSLLRFVSFFRSRMFTQQKRCVQLMGFERTFVVELPFGNSTVWQNTTTPSALGAGSSVGSVQPGTGSGCSPDKIWVNNIKVPPPLSPIITIIEHGRRVPKRQQ